jgi:hypothetical protein
MKYAAEMGSGAMIYIPSFIKIGSSNKVDWGGEGNTQVHRQHSDIICLLSFFQKKENKLNT